MLVEIQTAFVSLKAMESAFKDTKLVAEPHNKELLEYYNARRMLKEKINPILSAMRQQFVGENVLPDKKEDSPVKNFHFDDI
jgi:hypothetical protein